MRNTRSGVVRAAVTGFAGVIRVGLAACAIAGSGAADAQCDLVWTRGENRAGSIDVSFPAMAFDGARNRAVRFGGTFSGSVVGASNQTWEWDGLRWSLTVASTSPRRGSTMVYDSARARCVRFGGSTTGPAVYYGDTLAWNGVQWTTLSNTGPEARERMAMAYDSARDRVVLFGGSRTAPVTRFGDTWEWDGLTWTQVSLPPAISPDARAGAAMVYDSGRGVCVLFGGVATGPGLTDTWEWDGVTWTRRFSAGATPPQIQNPSMAYDAERERTTLYGESQTWEWDGVAWQLMTPTQPDPSRPSGQGELVYDSVQRKVLLAGRPWTGTWLWDGSAWQLRARTPNVEEGHSLAYDPVNQMVIAMFGASNSGDVSAWTGATWKPLPRFPFLGDSRTGAATATDWANNEVVVFGGRNNSFGPFLGDTWVWDGSVWSQRLGAGPPPDAEGAMVYDAARGHVVYLSSARETWLWDGAAWTPTGAAPPPIRPGAMAFDPVRGRVVLFGHYTPLATSEWDGVSWTTFTPPSSPSSRRGHAMYFDPDCGRVLLHGGYNAQGPLTLFADTWSWNGHAWTLEAAQNTPAVKRGMSVAYDSMRHAAVRWGGNSAPGLDAHVDLLSSVAPCPTDTNGDRFVNFADLNIVLSQFGQSGVPGALSGDVNDDGFVNFADLNIVLSNFGAAC